MLSKIYSATTLGLDGVLIKVEVDVAARGFPTFTIVGLPSKAIEESKERVRTAIHNSQFPMPEHRIVVNLAPADIPKEGSLFDLPIAVGILTSAGAIEKKAVAKSMFVGELSLDGQIRTVPGVLPIAILAKKKKIKSLFVPRDNAYEASMVGAVDVYPVKSLTDLILHLNDLQKIKKAKKSSLGDLRKKETYEYDFVDIRGQQQARRAMEIAAAGFHNVHMKGPPGAGKTLLARSFPSILPPLDEDEAIEVAKIASIARAGSEGTFSISRPFRAPHHTISRVGLIGGGSKVTPGEISFSHRGVLFFDELPEFPRSVLEALRQPLEDGIVTVSRARGSLTFPSRFVLIAASNPCPCGYLGHPKKPCNCTPWQIMKYKKRVSGPMLDRIDLHIDVPPVEYDKLTGGDRPEDSATIRARVQAARERQMRRFVDLTIKTNGEMSSSHVRKLTALTSEAETLLKQAVSRLSLSARSYFKIIKIAQTIADLKGHESIAGTSVSEALQYRVKEE